MLLGEKAEPLSRSQTFNEWLENPVCCESSVKDGNAVGWTVISVCGPEIFTFRNCPEFHQPGCNICYNLVVIVVEPSPS